MGAPTVRDVLSDVLPYLGIRPREDKTSDVSVPNVMGMTELEAKEMLKTVGLSFRRVGTGERVTDQLPVPEAVIPGESEIILYFGEEKTQKTVTVPDVLGQTPEEADRSLSEAGLYMKIIGASGDGAISAVEQKPEAGAQLEQGAVVPVSYTHLTLPTMAVV